MQNQHQKRRHCSCSATHSSQNKTEALSSFGSNDLVLKSALFVQLKNQIARLSIHQERSSQMSLLQKPVQADLINRSNRPISAENEQLGAKHSNMYRNLNKIWLVVATSTWLGILMTCAGRLMLLESVTLLIKHQES